MIELRFVVGGYEVRFLGTGSDEFHRATCCDRPQAKVSHLHMDHSAARRKLNCGQIPQHANEITRASPAAAAEAAFGEELMRVVARAADVDPELALRTAAKEFRRPGAVQEQLPG
jgi:hypothetical protein